MLVEITGKGNRVRSVVIPAWVKAAIDAWTAAASIAEGKIFRAVRKGGKVAPMGLEKLAPHDMRRVSEAKRSQASFVM